MLSRLYGAEIEVVRVKDRYFVMAAGDGVEVERDAHRHDQATATDATMHDDVHA